MKPLAPSNSSAKPAMSYKVHLFFLILLIIPLGPGFSGMRSARADHISEADVEQFVRAKIDLSESMAQFFRGRRSPRFGPDGPDMEALRKLETEINNHVSDILAEYNLTIEEYRGRGPEIFEDTEAVNRFLDAYPDLRERYKRLPQSPMGGRRR